MTRAKTSRVEVTMDRWSQSHGFANIVRFIESISKAGYDGQVAFLIQVAKAEKSWTVVGKLPQQSHILVGSIFLARFFPARENRNDGCPR